MLNLKTAFRQTAAFLDCWHWVLLALGAPLLLFPSPSRSPALLVVPAMWIAGWVAGREPLPRTPLNGALLLLNLMVLVSIYATYDIAVSLPKISGMVLAAGVFYAIAREGQRSRGWWLGFLVFLGMGLGVAGLGLLGTRWMAKVSFLAPVISRLPPRLTGLSGAEEGFHPNEVAGALLWVMPALIVLSVLLITKTKDLWTAFGRGRTTAVVSLMAAMTLFVTGVFVLTQSRGGYIAFALTGLTLIPIALPPRERWFFLGGLAILATILGVFLSQQEAATIWEGLIGSNPADDPAFSLNNLPSRLEVWSRAIYGIQDFPFTGMGMNTFRHIVHVLYPLFLVSPDFDIAHAHNEFLQAALDLGIPGLIAFLALYIGAFWMLGEIWRAVSINKSQAPNPNPFPPLPFDQGFPRVCLSSLRAQRSNLLGSEAHEIASSPPATLPLRCPFPFTSFRVRATAQGYGSWLRLLAMTKAPLGFTAPDFGQALPLDSLLLTRALVLGLGGGLFAHLLYGLTDAVALGAKPGILFWMLLGLVSGLFAQVRSGWLAG